MNKTTFKVGDKVRITDNNRYYFVGVGDIATVTSVEDGGSMLRCGPDYLREHESNEGGYHYFFREGQFELVKEPTTMTNYKHEVRRPTDYNDKNAVPDWNNGQIHGWNGGDCPVHPKTVVECWMRVDGWAHCKAGELDWGHSEKGFDIIAFQVVKEYVEPARPAALKVIWVNEYAPGTYFGYDDEGEARKGAFGFAHRIAVKYVEAIADAKEVKE